MENNRNVIVAIGLSFLVLLGWQYFIASPKIDAERKRQELEQTRQAEAESNGQAVTAGETAPAGTAPKATAPSATAPSASVPSTEGPAAPELTPSAPNAGSSVGSATAPTAPGQVVATAQRESATGSNQRVLIDTPSLGGSLNLVGGRIDHLILKGFRETIDPNSAEIELLSPVGSANPYYAEFGWVSPGEAVAVPNVESVWAAERDVLVPGAPVTLSWDNGDGLIFTRIITVDENYMFTVRQSVANQSGEAVTLYPYGLVNRHKKPDISGFYLLHEGMIGVFSGESRRKLKQPGYGDLDDEIEISPERSERGWIGITDKYWATALVPISADNFQGRFIRHEIEGVPTYQSEFLSDPVVINPDADGTTETLLFAGAKEVRLISDYESLLGIEKFNLLIDWGWFYFLTKPLFWTIDWFFKLLGNFGLAILATTVLIKLIFFPLANKSYASMSKMKKVQPEVKKLQERFKDDRMGLQKEMMALYKKEKINPLSGCWPIMIQIPVFFALYKVLFVTIEMRHAPFFGWIQDLSAPDPTSLFNLFGLLPFDPPQFLMIGIWPLIMGITMFIQMRMNPTPPDKTQAMIFAWMPLVFTFMLATFPAGLVIYWAWNNFLSILQQGTIMKRHGVKIELWDNIRDLTGKKPNKSPAE